MNDGRKYEGQVIDGPNRGEWVGHGSTRYRFPVMEPDALDSRPFKYNEYEWRTRVRMRDGKTEGVWTFVGEVEA